ncbi:hypothetical protein CY34DRAFT_798351 [Suillus luteus UH-Slu-Lm8-n1]|uniref:Uncharacterized protein n=1 Tax=Suillus luteus UH-Slu-Lm8-n1 TaxID=930992 RepID=A0A0D0BEP2_9AGAM|nr:hypothetical protein CY34DRAFT_798351 [Suillus luteus UH-Slu-Lm8-n1]
MLTHGKCQLKLQQEQEESNVRTSFGDEKSHQQPVGCNPTRPSLGARRPSQRRRGPASHHQKTIGPGQVDGR